MTRFRVGLGVSAVLLTLTFLVLAWVVKRPGGADSNSLPEPVSYAKPSPNGARVFVAFGSPEYEAGLKDAKTREFAAGVRARYPTPGLYAGDTRLAPATSPAPIAAVTGVGVFATDPAWWWDPYPHPTAAVTGVAVFATDPAWWWDRYTPDENVYLTADGSTVVRIEGEWWKEKAYPAGKRLSGEAEEEQLNAPAVTFLFADGRPPQTYLLKELVDTPAELPHSPKHILWPAGASLNPETNQFHLFTQDSTRITFDATTGKIVHKGKNGLGNPVAQAVIFTTIGLTVLLAGVLGWFILRARKVGAASRTAPAPKAETGVESR